MYTLLRKEKKSNNIYIYIYRTMIYIPLTTHEYDIQLKRNQLKRKRAVFSNAKIDVLVAVTNRTNMSDVYVDM
jgi:hypothetical protein